MVRIGRSTVGRMFVVGRLVVAEGGDVDFFLDLHQFFADTTH